MERAEERQETTIKLRVPDGYQEGARLDVYITRFLENASRTKVQRGIKQGRVTVNGSVVSRPSHVLQAGDEIECRLPRPPPVELVPEPIALDIVYEDAALIVVNKAAGMVVHPAYGHRQGTLVNALLHHIGATTRMLGSAPAAGEETPVGLSGLQEVSTQAHDVVLRPGIVHRLDKDTTGLMVVAKDDEVHRILARQFAERTIRRRYLALLWGVPDPQAGSIETALGRDPRDRKRMAVVPKGRGKYALTHYEVLEPFLHTALVRFQLATGRTHQIRVHASHIGHPILGDPTYEGRRIRYGLRSSHRKAFYANLFGVLTRQALHAHTLGFTHPATGEEMDFEVPLPEDMNYVLDRLRAVEGGGPA